MNVDVTCVVAFTLLFLGKTRIFRSGWTASWRSLSRAESSAPKSHRYKKQSQVLFKDEERIIDSLMDIKMDPTLTAAEWLNQQFASSEAQENFEAFSARLTTSLQLHLYKTQQTLDELSSQLPQIAATFTRSMPHTRSSTSYLIRDIAQVESNVSDCVSSSADVVQKIRATELVKNRMEATYRSLESQDNWDALISNIKDVIASGDLDAIGGRILALQKCFVSLTDAANHSERTDQLEDVKNRIESLLIPKLISALSSVEPWKTSGSGSGTGSESAALRIIAIFGVMERKSTVKRAVKDTRLKQMVEHWNELVQTFQGEAGGSLDECVSTFYDDLLASWHAQVPLFSAAFPEPIVALVEHFHSILSSTSSQLVTLLDSSWKKCDSSSAAQDFLALLLDIKRAQEGFLKTFEKECVASRNNQQVGDLFTIIRRPLGDWSRKYPDVEKVIIFAEVNRIQLDNSDQEKTSHILAGAGSKIGTLLYSVVVRCLQITNGEALPKILDLVLEACRTHIRKVEVCGKAVSEMAAAESDNATSAELSQSSLEILTHLVKLLQHCGDLLVQMDNIAEVLRRQNASSSFPQFSSMTDDIKHGCNAVFQHFVTIILRPLSPLLDSIPGLSSWTRSSTKAGIELPSYGLDPQEYITRIGNYLLTLPQVMDPLLSSDSSGMKVLKAVIEFGGVSPLDDSVSVAEASIQATIWAAMERVTTAVMKIRHATAFGIRQLHCDLKYLQNVVEDFAVPSSPVLGGLLMLLMTPLEEWQSRSSDTPAEVAGFVKRMRNIE